jgi:methyltransferase (TIGR00027 family)
MRLPDLSYMMKVGQIRSIQAKYETLEHRNPDRFVRHFLSARQRWGCMLRGRLFLNRIRRQPFYYFVLARTRYYDQIFKSAILQGFDCIINIGCGSDTRAYRYQTELKARKVQVLECDQADAIAAKRDMARRSAPAADHVDYLALDLNASAWPGLAEWLAKHPSRRCLVMLEGVSPYVQTEAFAAFLSFLAAKLPVDSRLAYDFKRRDVAEGFGRTNVSPEPFRMPDDLEQVTTFHRPLGWLLDHFERSGELCRRLVPGLSASQTKVFEEDCLIQLQLEPAPPATDTES